MAAVWSLMVIAFAVLSELIGVALSPLRFETGLISREKDPGSFRKAVSTQVVIVLLFILRWVTDFKWHVFQ